MVPGLLILARFRMEPELLLVTLPRFEIQGSGANLVFLRLLFRVPEFEKLPSELFCIAPLLEKLPPELLVIAQALVRVPPTSMLMRPELVRVAPPERFNPDL